MTGTWNPGEGRGAEGGRQRCCGEGFGGVQLSLSLSLSFRCSVAIVAAHQLGHLASPSTLQEVMVATSSAHQPITVVPTKSELKKILFKIQTLFLVDGEKSGRGASVMSHCEGRRSGSVHHLQEKTKNKTLI